jgi:hypothetical protein
MGATSAAASTAVGMTEVTAGITSLGGVMTSVVGMITGNPILVLFLASSVVGLGIGLFRKLRKR